MVSLGGKKSRGEDSRVKTAFEKGVAEDAHSTVAQAKLKSKGCQRESHTKMFRGSIESKQHPKLIRRRRMSKTKETIVWLRKSVGAVMEMTPKEKSSGGVPTRKSQDKKVKTANQEKGQHSSRV